MKTTKYRKLSKSLKSFAVLKPVCTRRSESVTPNRKYVPLTFFRNENSLSDLLESSSISELSVMNNILGKQSIQLDVGSNETHSFYQSEPELTNSRVSLLSTT